MMEARKGVRYTPEQRAAYLKAGGTPFLDRDYTVFGHVISGLEVIDAIAGVQTERGDRPKQDVSMKVVVIK
jgi:cyclophilin family peptidyl-prolyl cis-trans isomerase